MRWAPPPRLRPLVRPRSRRRGWTRSGLLDALLGDEVADRQPFFSRDVVVGRAVVGRRPHRRPFHPFERERIGRDLEHLGHWIAVAASMSHHERLAFRISAALETAQDTTAANVEDLRSPPCRDQLRLGLHSSANLDRQAALRPLPSGAAGKASTATRLTRRPRGHSRTLRQPSSSHPAGRWRTTSDARVVASCTRLLSSKKRFDGAGGPTPSIRTTAGRRTTPRKVIAM